MKTIFDFAYCDGELTPAVVWYQVRVGISKADKSAHQFVMSRARATPSMFYARHSMKVAEYLENVALSLFPFNGASALMLRRKTIDVQALARFIRDNPLALLNSERIDTSLHAQYLNFARFKPKKHLS